MPRTMPELLDEIREFTVEEHGRISVKIVSIRFTLSRTCIWKAYLKEDRNESTAEFGRDLLSDEKIFKVGRCGSRLPFSHVSSEKTGAT